MENLNEITVASIKLSQDGKSLYLENIIELCNKDYNMERANIISKVSNGVDLKLIKKAENKHGKLSYLINKDAIKESKVRNTDEIFENDDTLSSIDNMCEEVRYKASIDNMCEEVRYKASIDNICEEVRYKALKEKLLDDIKVDVRKYITKLEVNEKFSRNDSTILSETHDQKWYDARIKSLETELPRKNGIIYNMSKYFHNINSHNASCKTQLPWQFEDSGKI